jgi:hypothetical protein
LPVVRFLSQAAGFEAASGQQKALFDPVTMTHCRVYFDIRTNRSIDTEVSNPDQHLRTADAAFLGLCSGTRLKSLKSLKSMAS